MSTESKKSGVNGVISSAVNLLSGQMEDKMNEDQARVDALVAEVEEIDAKNVKVESKPAKVGPKKRKVVNKTAKVEAKKEAQKKGGDNMDHRKNAEATLAKVAKELGISIQRIQPKRDIQVNPGALQAIRADGLKAVVRANDVCLYSPYSVIKIGKPEVASYPHVTLVKHNDPKLEEAFRRCLKDKKSNLQWATELKASRRTKNLDNISQRKERLKAELKALMDIEKNMKKKETRLKKLLPAKAEA